MAAFEINVDLLLDHIHRLLKFDDLLNYNDNWGKDNSTDFCFINFDIAKRFKFGINKYEGKNYSLFI